MAARTRTRARTHARSTSGGARTPPLRDTLLAVAGFSATYLVVETALRWMADAGRFEWLQLWTAQVAASALRAAGLHAVLAGVSVVTDAGTVSVEPSCLPITPIAIAVALFGFASPGRPLRRFAYACGLCAAVVLVNVLRIVAVSVLVGSRSAYTDVVHRELLPILLVAVVVGGWLATLRRGSDA